MPRGRIVALATVVIPPANTPEKMKSDSLIASPVWKYIGPGDTINFEWQVGLWNSTFNGITTRNYTTRSQPASAELKEFTIDLPAISLSALSPGYYDCEIWFKDKFSDLRVIVQNCVKIVEVTQALQVIVALKNPPSGANMWGLSLYDWTGQKYLSQTVTSVGGKATLDIPSDWAWPLRFWISIISYNGGTTVLHQSQSVSPDWPNYIEEFIHESWVYFYNVTTRRFEKA